MPSVSGFIRKTKRLAADAAEFPTDCVRGIPDVEIRGDGECFVSGCLTILEYCCESVKFDAGSVTVTVRGSGLLLSEFRSGCMRVKGEIASVTFEKEK
ncbi:MAG: YabP/YqfC family sporulation protein [Clostridia bacterium]|nr:YabP/YqfC family sporulation protein [Clostridia bacterium]